MQFIYGDCELLLVAGHILSAAADVIVTPANAELEHTDGLAAEIAQQAGEVLLLDSAQLLREYGALDYGMALFTRAGRLPYRAIIHAVVPEAGHAETQRMLELAVSRSLQLCEMNDWRSVAFPAFSESGAGLDVTLCAQALYRAVTRFWDARHETVLRQVSVYLSEEDYLRFCTIMRSGDTVTSHELAQTDPAENVGYIDLSAEDLPAADDEIDGWFR